VLLPLAAAVSVEAMAGVIEDGGGLPQERHGALGLSFGQGNGDRTSRMAACHDVLPRVGPTSRPRRGGYRAGEDAYSSQLLIRTSPLTQVSVPFPPRMLSLWSPPSR
jgi:hypothetical protein